MSSTFRGQTFVMEGVSADGFEPQWESSGQEIAARAFIGTSGAIDIQGVATPIQTWTVPIYVLDLTTIPALQAFTKPANVATGTLVDEGSTSWTNVTLMKVATPKRQQYASKQRATLTFLRAAP